MNSRIRSIEKKLSVPDDTVVVVTPDENAWLGRPDPGYIARTFKNGDLVSETRGKGPPPEPAPGSKVYRVPPSELERNKSCPGK